MRSLSTGQKLSGILFGVLAALFLSMIAPILTSAQMLPSDPPAGDGTLRRIRVPILMYHYISPLPADADEYRTGLTLEPNVFHDHLNYLRDEGYTTISLYDLYGALMQGQPLPPRPVILTFDDGYIEHYTTVYPLLKAYGFTATFFIITGRADQGDPNYMSWSHIKEMAANGMSMEAHTKSHLDLRERSYDFLVYEIVGSIESLESHTRRAVRMFCYPAGRYDEYTLQILGSMPVWIGVTTQPGTHHTTTDPLELPRLRITRETGAAGLAHLLNRVG